MLNVFVNVSDWTELLCLPLVAHLVTTQTALLLQKSFSYLVFV